MKILIAYDGSRCANVALDDLQRAGLPPEAEVEVLSVADVWLPPRESLQDPNTETIFNQRSAAARSKVREHALLAVDGARAFAAQARERLLRYFPAWTIRAEACADSPAWAVIKKADEWQPHLVVVGSHGHSTIGRILLGSVSEKVLTQARCSIRVARGGRKKTTASARLVIGVDGSPEALAAVGTVVGRVWPADSEACVLAVLDQMLSATAEWSEQGDTDVATRVHAITEAAVEQLRAAGLRASSKVVEGDPKRILVEEATRWRADCIFVGARGLRRLERFLLGSVSIAVAARAPCSVEVVHTEQTA
jgi:nucleotide-binding universal stress UspA family protein